MRTDALVPQGCFGENRKQPLRSILIAAVIILSTAIGILGLQSFVEVVLYAQPMHLRVAKNIYAFIADVVVLIAALPICIGPERMLHRKEKNN